jgi:plasmid stabilization system protein ParE
MKIEVLPVALREMLREARWYDARAAGLGDRFSTAIRSAFLVLKEFPTAHPMIHPPYRRLIVKGFPFAVVFRIDADRIIVAAIAHLKRRPLYWLRRVKT